MNRQFEMGFGDRKVSIALPAAQILDVIEGKRLAALTDVSQAVREVLRNPLGSSPLNAVVAPTDKVAVVVSDITRQWVRHDLFLPPLFDELNRAGVPDENITLVVALGAHRPHTQGEHAKVYGEAAVGRVNIVQSSAQISDDFVTVGRTKRGVEVQINRHVVNADKVILTGGIVYHSMAGFSGGRKSILPGVASYASIQGNHRFCLHEVQGRGLNPNCDSGLLASNDMHQDQMEMAQMVNPAFLLNAIYTPEGDIARFVAGHWHEAWQAGCRIVADIYGIPTVGQADLTVVSAGGFPKDINFYQGSKAIENAFTATKPGGVMIAFLECRDILEPSDFSHWFDYQSLIEREAALREAFTVPGFVALKIGLIAQQVTLIMLTLPENREFFTHAGLRVAVDPAGAFAEARQILGTEDYTITVMPHAASTVPVLTSA